MKNSFIKGIAVAVTMAWIVFSFPGSAFSFDIVIIANNKVPTSSLSEGDIQNIFLGKKRGWDNGTKITPVVQKGTEAHKFFTKTYVGKSEAQFINYWKKLLFTGKGTPPKAFSDERELAAYVAGTDGSIGYVSTGTNISNNLKQITIK